MAAKDVRVAGGLERGVDIDGDDGYVAVLQLYREITSSSSALIAPAMFEVEWIDKQHSDGQLREKQGVM